jgi:hypothetical protein
MSGLVSTDSDQPESALDRIRRLIRRKRSEHSRLEREMMELETELAPLDKREAEVDRLDAGLHDLFLRAGREPNLSRKARSVVSRVYVQLQEAESLSFRNDAERDCPCPACTPNGEPQPDAQTPPGAEPDFGPRPDYFGQAPPPGAGSHEHLSAGAEQGERDETLRQLYKKLALKFHPDRASDDERERHARIMRDINSAYHDMDTERLLELSRELGVSVEELKSSSGVLDELLQQYELIKEDVRHLRATLLGNLVIETRRARRFDDPLPLVEIDQMITERGRKLENIHAFVLDFLDGRMSLDDFARGPFVRRRQHRGASKSR